MSELRNTAIFKDLEGLRPLDSYTETVVRQAKLLEAFVNKAYRDLDCTELEMSEVQREATERIALMSRECPYIGQPVEVSGDVIKSFSDALGEFDSTDDVFTREAVWSAGYMLRSVTTVDGDMQAQVGHLFNLESLPSVSHDESGLVRMTPTLHAFARAGTVDIETFGLEDQCDGERLQREIPKLYKELHGRIDGVDDECVALCNLSRMHVPIAYDLPIGVQRRFEAYAYAQLKLDTVLPYALTVQGAIERVDLQPTVTYNFIDEQQLYGVPERIVFEPVYIPNDDGVAVLSKDRHWSLQVRVLGHDYEDNNDQYLIPISRLLSMQSVRDELHQAIQYDDGAERSDEGYMI